MARNEHLVHASPTTVFGVLADPRSYAYRVVGSKEVRDADRTWPQPGSRAVPAPWRWSGVDWAVSVLHHGVYAGATHATYVLLDARGHG